MTDISNELIIEILKSIQKAVSDVRATQAEHSRQLLKVREDINNLRGDDLRREAMQAQMDSRLDRIENRLNLTDPKH